MSAEKNAWEKVGIARLPERPTTKTYIDNIFTDFIELHGDRCFGDDTAIIGGIGRLNGLPVTVIGEEKGGNTKEKLYRNFGCPNPEGYRKSLRLMKQAEKFKRPIICFVDTQGAFCGIGAEERGQGQAIAENLISMINLKVPIISVVIGEGGSGGALALAVADKVWMLENATYSILSPEGFASILWKDATKADKAAEAMKLTAKDLFNLKVIDKVIGEPDGGAHKNVSVAVNNLKQELTKEMEALLGIDIAVLLQNRYEKFRKMGSYK